MLLASMIASVVAYFEFGSVCGFTPMFDRRIGWLPAWASWRLGALRVSWCPGRPARPCLRVVVLPNDDLVLQPSQAAGRTAPGRGRVRGRCAGFAVLGALGTGYATIQLELNRDTLLGTSLWLMVAMPLVKAT